MGYNTDLIPTEAEKHIHSAIRELIEVPSITAREMKGDTLHVAVPPPVSTMMRQILADKDEISEHCDDIRADVDRRAMNTSSIASDIETLVQEAEKKLPLDESSVERRDDSGRYLCSNVSTLQKCLEIERNCDALACLIKDRYELLCDDHLMQVVRDVKKDMCPTHKGVYIMRQIMEWPQEAREYYEISRGRAWEDRSAEVQEMMVSWFMDKFRDRSRIDLDELMKGWMVEDY